MATAKHKSTTGRTSQAESRRSAAETGASKARASKRADANIRERVHKLTLKALRDHELSLGDIPRLAQEFIESAAAGLNRAVPASSRNVLRQVVDGLTDAAEAAVRSTKNLVASTTRRGQQFVKHDASRALNDLRTIEDEFLAALGRAGGKLSGAAKQEMDAIVRHSRRAGTRIKPAAQTVLKAAEGHLLELGKETAGASGRAARSAVSAVLQGASGLLQGLADTLDTTRSRAKKTPK